MLHHRPSRRGGSGFFPPLVTCPPLTHTHPAATGPGGGGCPVRRALGAGSVPSALWGLPVRVCRSSGGGRARGVSVVGSTWGGVSPSALCRTGELPQAEERCVAPAAAAARGLATGLLRGGSGQVARFRGGRGGRPCSGLRWAGARYRQGRGAGGCWRRERGSGAAGPGARRGRARCPHHSAELPLCSLRT